MMSRTLSLGLPCPLECQWTYRQLPIEGQLVLASSCGRADKACKGHDMSFKGPGKHRGSCVHICRTHTGLLLEPVSCSI